jgi:murein DD-endopeptidase MepM/ murein hydrolase activator NlpD
LKRAFPQKVKSVSCHPFVIDAVVGQARRTLPGVNRRARTSAAMIGLALSMGASSLLLPRQDDGAAAAEPRTTESAVVATSVEHVVQQGQTLWQIARRYGVSAEAIAASNGITTDSTLRVGQTLWVSIPGVSNSSDHISTDISPEAAPAATPESISALPSTSLNSNRLRQVEPGLDDSLKAEQDIALERLHQRRERLRNSLAELRSEELQNLVTAKGEAEPSVQPPVETALSSVSPAAAEPSSSPLAASIEMPQVDSQLPRVAGSATYQVQPGDTLDAIARSHGLTRRELAEVNQLSDPNWLQINQSLAIPQSQPIALARPVPAAGSTQNSELSNFPVLPSLPNSATAQPDAPKLGAQSEASLTVYQVNPGDTLSEIARTYGISRSELIGANGLGDPNLIFVGQELEIPSSSGLEANAEEITVPGAVVSVPTVVASSTVLPEQFAPESVGQMPAVVAVPTVPTPAVVASSEQPSDSIPAVGGALPSVDAGENDAGEKQVEQSRQVAAVPSSQAAPTAADAEVASAQLGANQYVQSLMSEIRDLRDRYQTEIAETKVEPAIVAAAPTGAPASLTALPNPSSDINPEFSPDRYTEAFQAEIRRLQEARRNQATQLPVQPNTQISAQVEEVASLPSSTTEPQTEEELVAVAPLGSENYQPLTQPITGRLVSPDLPPLSGAEAYLPDGTTAFDGYLWPARGTLTSGYGWRWGRMHRGIDIGAPTGTPVVAAAPGVVEFSGWNSGGYGNMVEIRHADGSMTRYAHHSRNLVRAGQEVDQGQQIAEVGSTGYSTGPHLHFEVHLPNQGTVNPIAYLPR